MLTCFESLKQPNGFIPQRRYNFKFPTGKSYSIWVSSRIGRHFSGDLYSHGPNQGILSGRIIFWSETPITKVLPQWNGENRWCQDGDAFLVLFPITACPQLLGFLLESRDMFPENSIPTVLANLFCVGESYFGRKHPLQKPCLSGTRKIAEIWK